MFNLYLLHIGHFGCIKCCINKDWLIEDDMRVLSHVDYHWDKDRGWSCVKLFAFFNEWLNSVAQIAWDIKLNVDA